ncbi:capsule assembly Wzi family protein [Povalibacter sp.]|uniref:capsule assembly Wzi family protein n=1 Tax=Povalibacter sp. TaxID=1962978 RepID=UPI002F422BC9
MLAVCLSPTAQARGASPYLPLNLSPEIERQVEQVMLLAGRPIIKRPFAAAEVLDALPAACNVDKALCTAVRRYLDAYMNRLALTHASVEIAATRDSDKTLPNRHGMGAEDTWNASAQGLFQFSDYILIQGGGLAYPDETSPVGSWISMGFEYAQVDIGYRDHWWSPMTDSSMLISTHAPTMPGITISNYKPISRFGFQYELYAAEMSHRDNFTYLGEPVTGKPRIGGALVAIEPAPGWSLSVSRLLQYGGGPRPDSFGDFIDAFFNPVKYDNVADPTQDQFGNQVAALATRFVFPARTPFAVYFEYAGEDSSRGEGWRLGNASLSAGIDIPRIWDQFDLTLEISDWQNLWYVNNVYADGTSNDGHVIGHWGGDDRVLGNAVGAQSQSLRVGWVPRFGGKFEMRFRSLKNEEYYGVDYEREYELALRYSRAWRDFVFGAEVHSGKDVFGEDFGRFAAFARYVPGQPAFDRIAVPLSDSRSRIADSVEIFIDAGINASQLKYNPSDKGVTPETDVSTTGPHLAVGARRAMSRSVDLGVRAEFDTVDGQSMIGVRAIDYRYRFGKKFAVSAFAGATRYDGPTAAYGYYGGAGAHWRDALPRMDVNLDLRATDKVARDAPLVPGDPNSAWGDVTYQIYSANLYLSYRFR